MNDDVSSELASRGDAPALPAAILAGGLAMRLGPIVAEIPKALVDVAGKPFILRQLSLLRRNGIQRVVLCVGHLGEAIRQCVGDGSAMGMSVEYSFDGPTLLGTGGALRKALPRLGEAFFVLYGDSYLPIDYQAVAAAFFQSRKAALMTVYQNEGRWDKSNVVFQDGRILAYDKRNSRPEMLHIDYGLGVFSRRALGHVRDGEKCDLADVYAHWLQRGELAGCQVQRRFYEIGSPAGLETLRKAILENDLEG
jgi:NDP-sugar pyrophosphorylase family protein